MRYRQIHNLWGLYAGPNDPTGYHFADYNGERHNNPQLSIFDENLLKPIDRINSFRYNIEAEKVNVSQLGVKGLVKRSMVNSPTINFDFNYYLVGVRNEDRLGFTVNYPDITGKPILSQETSFFNNFTGWKTDCRNMFLAIAPEHFDLNNNVPDQFHNGQISPSGLYVLGYGNCYVRSYAINAAVGAFPQANVGYSCENILILKSGSGAQIPAIIAKSGNLVSGVKFTIPRYESVSSPSVIRPGDITLRIGSLNTDFYETTEAIFGLNSSGLNIQSFDIRANLDREPLRSVGYQYPIDHRLNSPIFVDININTIVDNNYSGNLAHFIRRNETYDILVNMLTPGCDNNREIALQYKIKNAKFEGLSYSYELNNKLIGNFKFIAEIDVNNSDKDMYVSGILNEPIPEFPFNFLRLEQNKTGFLYTEGSNLLIVGEN